MSSRKSGPPAGDATVSMSYDAARQNLKAAPNSRWPGIAAEFSGWVWPTVANPSFKLTASDTIFTIGSCFARNVEEHVARLGCRVPMLELNLPPEEWRGPANSAMNKFNPPAFAQVLEWAGRIHDRDKCVAWEDCAPFALASGDRFFDIDMGATPPVTRERFIARRQHIFDIFSTVFTADCLMMTPGLIEAWRDKETGIYLHEAPAHKAALAHASRFEFVMLSYQQCEAALLAAIDAVRSRNPGIKILVTTSPVPLSATFSGQDIRIANTYSKSILRAVCGALTLKRPNVDYFPSYESVMLSHPDDVWQEDRIHVSYAFVGQIVAHMLSAYFADADGSGELFQSAMAAISRNDNAAAAEALTQALKARPNFVQAQILLADTKTSLGRAAEAVPELRALAEAMPQNADVQLKLARALMHLDGKRPEAYEIITRAIEMDSITLVQFDSIQRMIKEAPLALRERIAREGVKRFPLHAAMYLELGEVLEQGGSRTEAVEVFAKGAELHRPPPALQTRLTGLLAEHSSRDEALNDVMATPLQTPSDSDATKALAPTAALKATTIDLQRDSTLNGALTRIAMGGVNVGSIIKIGAGSGADTRYVEHHFPKSRTLLIEMDPAFEPQWRALQLDIPTLQWAICGAADEDRDGYMRKSNLTGGVITAEASPDSTPIKHRKIDTLVRELGMESPYFLRFDTHGAEFLVLAGATETIKHTTLIQMECYNFKHVTFDKMVGYMRENGFRMIDMCEPLWRDDGAFWQMHLFFVREDHPSFRRNSFSTR